MSAADKGKKEGISKPKNQAQLDAGGLLYRLTAAFPSLGGAILAVYFVLLCGLGALKIRSR